MANPSVDEISDAPPAYEEALQDPTIEYGKYIGPPLGHHGDAYPQHMYGYNAGGGRRMRQRRRSVDAESTTSETDLTDSCLRMSLPPMHMCLAVTCLILNILVPGTGTMLAALGVFCFARTADWTIGKKCSICCLNMGIGFAQLLLSPVLLIGWIWSILWGFAFLGVSHEEYHAPKPEDETPRENVLTTMPRPISESAEWEASSSGDHANHIQLQLIVHRSERDNMGYEQSPHHARRDTSHNRHGAHEHSRTQQREAAGTAERQPARGQNNGHVPVPPPYETRDRRHHRTSANESSNHRSTHRADQRRDGHYHASVHQQSSHSQPICDVESAHNDHPRRHGNDTTNRHNYESRTHRGGNSVESTQVRNADAGNNHQSSRHRNDDRHAVTDDRYNRREYRHTNTGTNGGQSNGHTANHAETSSRRNDRSSDPYTSQHSEARDDRHREYRYHNQGRRDSNHRHTTNETVVPRNDHVATDGVHSNASGSHGTSTNTNHGSTHRNNGNRGNSGHSKNATTTSVSHGSATQLRVEAAPENNGHTDSSNHNSVHPASATRRHGNSRRGSNQSGSVHSHGISMNPGSCDLMASVSM